MQGIYRCEVALQGCESLNPAVVKMQIKAKDMQSYTVTGDRISTWNKHVITCEMVAGNLRCWSHFVCQQDIENLKKNCDFKCQCLFISDHWLKNTFLQNLFPCLMQIEVDCVGKLWPLRFLIKLQGINLQSLWQDVGLWDFPTSLSHLLYSILKSTMKSLFPKSKKKFRRKRHFFVALTAHNGFFC